MHRIDGAGHVNHRFVSEDPASSRPPTEVTPEILNAIQEELAGFIEWAQIALDKGDNTQLRQALLSRFVTKVGIQTQENTAFTTSGETGAFVITPNPAVTAYVAGQRFRAEFHVAGNGSDVINISGLGNKSLKQYDSAGVKVAPIIAAGQLVDIEYDGVDFVLLDPMPNPRGSKAFLASGNFTVPAGVTTVFLTGCGGGGGGAAYYSSSYGGGGGGAGASCMKRSAIVTPGATVIVTIGAQGQPGLTVGAAGGSGGTTSFGALLTLAGGAGGVSGGQGGVGGAISGGVGVGTSGQQGETCNRVSSITSGGNGGSSMFGGGGTGGSAAVTPLAAGGYGSGGGGGGGGQGSIGSGGFLIVEW